ncbi:Uma2 family endonuclease [Streptomyces albidoflavus]|uniref:Uma2 family endonuclease n=1 Tax=Streptomyces TaxID=1883 RepID=UPI0022570A2E|nr:Uma2 family endonuclease [Streptomyces sp. FT1]MCX5458615.1 Uma2 family endonuclease [Streptomyces sp. FT1]
MLTDEGPRPGVADFYEALAVPEGYRAEFLRGTILLTAAPGLVHNRIVTAIQDQIPYRRWERLQTQDIGLLKENSEPQPDLVVLERGKGPDHGRLLPVELVTLLVEVVSRSSVDRDYGDKRSIYAAGGVPGYLIVDPMAAQCVLLTEPYGEGEQADYGVEQTFSFGLGVPVPLLGVELETAEFPTLPPVKRHRRP